MVPSTLLSEVVTFSEVAKYRVHRLRCWPVGWRPVAVGWAGTCQGGFVAQAPLEVVLEVQPGCWACIADTSESAHVRAGGWPCLAR